MRPNNAPILSIVVLCYNDERFVEQCLESVRVSDGIEDFEVIVVDNGSSDASPRLISEFLDRTGVGWRVIRLDPNRGPCGGWNAGIAVARGKYIAAVAADDFFDSGRFSGPVNRLEDLDDSVVMAGCSVQWVHESGSAIGDPVTSAACREPAPVVDLMLAGVLPKTVARVYRTECLRGLGGFDERFPVEDAPLDWRLSTHRNAKAVWTGDGIVFYRQHAGAFTSALSISLNARMAAMCADELSREVGDDNPVVLELRSRAARFRALIPYETLLFAASEQPPGWRRRLLAGALRDPLRVRHRISVARFAVLPSRSSRARYRRSWMPPGFLDATGDRDRDA